MMLLYSWQCDPGGKDVKPRQTNRLKELELQALVAPKRKKDF